MTTEFKPGDRVITLAWPQHIKQTIHRGVVITRSETILGKDLPDRIPFLTDEGQIFYYPPKQLMLESEYDFAQSLRGVV